MNLRTSSDRRAKELQAKSKKANKTTESGLVGLLSFLGFAFLGPAFGHASTHDAVRASLDAYEELGVEECWLNTATAELAEIDGLLEVLEKRG